MKIANAMLLALAVTCLADAGPHRELLGKVEKGNGRSSQVAARVTVVVFGGPHFTDDNGLFHIPVPDNVQPGDNIEISVTAPGYAMYEPRDGQIRIPTEAELSGTRPQKRALIQLLPPGSKNFESQPYLTAVARLLVEKALLDQRLDNVQIASSASLDHAVRDWAAQHRLPYSDVNARFHAWANDVLAHSSNASDDETSLETRADAELMSKHYEQAAAMFDNIANLRRGARRRKEEQHLAELREDLRRELVSKLKSGFALGQAGLFTDRTKMYQEAQQEAETEHRRYPEDTQIRSLWLLSSVLLLSSRKIEASTTRSWEVTGKELAAIIGDCRELRDQMDRNEYPDLWFNLNQMLLETTALLSYRSDAASAAQLRDQLLLEARNLAASYDPDKPPERANWAEARVTYADLLTEKINSWSPDLTFDQAASLAAEAKSAYESALTVLTREDHPRLWALTRVQMGALAFLMASKQSYLSGQVSPALLAEAEGDFQDALKEFDPDTEPYQWANPQRGLAAVLLLRAEAAVGPDTRSLWMSGLAALRLAIDHLAKERDPVTWVGANSELAVALQSASDVVGKGDAIALLDQAVSVVDQELTVLNKEHSAHDWEMAQANLGLILWKRALREEAQKAHGDFEDAATAYRAALGVLTKEAYPWEWAAREFALGGVLYALSEATSAENPQRAGVHLEDARAALSASLEVFTKKTWPKEWGASESALANVLSAQSQRASGARARQLMTQAAEAYRSVLEVRPKGADILTKLGVLLHEQLFDFEAAYPVMARLEEVQPNDENRLNAAESALTAGKFSDCTAVLGEIDTSKLQQSLIIPLRVLLSACQWGTKDRAAAISTLSLLEEPGVDLVKDGWTTEGDRIYLAKSRTFSSQRSSWMRMFEALQAGSRASLAESARSLNRAIAH